MNLRVKIYMKRYDRHNKTYWTTDTDFLSFFLYIIFPKIKVYVSHWTKVVSESNLTGGGGGRKTHLESGLPICHKLLDIRSFSLTLLIYEYVASSADG